MVSNLVIGTGKTIYTPPDCPMCVAFNGCLEKMAMDSTSWYQRDKLLVVFRAAHDDNIFDGTRAWWMLKALGRGGWPKDILLQVAKAIVDVGLE